MAIHKTVLLTKRVKFKIVCLPAKKPVSLRLRRSMKPMLAGTVQHHQCLWPKQLAFLFKVSSKQPFPVSNPSLFGNDRREVRSEVLRARSKSTDPQSEECTMERVKDLLQSSLISKAALVENVKTNCTVYSVNVKTTQYYLQPVIHSKPLLKLHLPV